MAKQNPKPTSKSRAGAASKPVAHPKKDHEVDAPSDPSGEPRPALKKAGAFKPQVHVRMYLQGLGDCFLIRFETAKDTFFTILIDCGIYKASPDAGALMNLVVNDVVKETGNRVDVLVSTHEHWDPHLRVLPGARQVQEVRGRGGLAGVDGRPQEPAGEPIAGRSTRRRRRNSSA